jgi:hypothetical protein
MLPIYFFAAIGRRGFPASIVLQAALYVQGWLLGGGMGSVHNIDLSTNRGQVDFYRQRFVAGQQSCRPKSISDGPAARLGLGGQIREKLSIG